MRVMGLLFVLSVVALATSGCVGNQADRLQQADLDQLKTQVKAMGQRVDTLELQVSVLQARPYQAAVLDPSEKGYSRVDTGQGFFPISVDNVEPYLDGYRVTLNIGNPQFAVYNGFTIKAKWGPQWDFQKTGQSFSDWEKALREKDFTLADTLLSGSWNKVEFVLSPAKADEVGYIEVSMTTNEVSLRRQ